VIVGVAALVVLVLGARYARRAAGELDQRIGAKIVAHLSGHPRLVSWLVPLGNPLSIVVLVLTLVAVLVLLKRPAAALLALAGPAIAAILTELVLKPLVGRRLDGGLEYPSGHVDHGRASEWLDEEITARWASCPITENGLARILSQPRYPSPVAIELLGRACVSRHHEFWACVSVLDPPGVDRSRLHGPANSELPETAAVRESVVRLLADAPPEGLSRRELTSRISAQDGVDRIKEVAPALVTLTHGPARTPDDYCLGTHPDAHPPFMP